MLLNVTSVKEYFFLDDPEDMMLSEDPDEWYIENVAASPIE